MVPGAARVHTLTHINPQRPSVDNTPQLFASYPSPAEVPPMEQPKLRFAVGTFDTWKQVSVALHDLRVRGLLGLHNSSLGHGKASQDATIQ